MEIVKRRHQVRRVIPLGTTLCQASLNVALRRPEGPPARSGLPRRSGIGLLRGLALGRGPSTATLWSGIQLGWMATTINVVRSILKLDSVPSLQERDPRVIVPVGFAVPNHSEHGHLPIPTVLSSAEQPSPPVLTKRVKRCGGADPQVGRKGGAMAGRLMQVVLDWRLKGQPASRSGASIVAVSIGARHLWGRGGLDGPASRRPGGTARSLTHGGILTIVRHLFPVGAFPGRPILSLTAQSFEGLLTLGDLLQLHHRGSRHLQYFRLELLRSQKSFGPREVLLRAGDHRLAELEDSFLCALGLGPTSGLLVLLYFDRGLGRPRVGKIRAGTIFLDTFRFWGCLFLERVFGLEDIGARDVAPWGTPWASLERSKS